MQNTRLLALALLLGTAACSEDTVADPTTTTAITQTFSGTLAAGTARSHGFTVNQTGLATVTLTSLSPQAGITVGLAVGQPATDGTCGALSFNEAAHVSAALSGTAAPGNYCATVYDVGNILGSDDYSLTVSHY